jgi:hypothetical protein
LKYKTLKRRLCDNYIKCIVNLKNYTIIDIKCEVFLGFYSLSSDAQRSSVWHSVTKASAERPDFAERERALERLTPERQVIVIIIFNIRNTVKIFLHYKKLIFTKYNFLHKIFHILI